jgi:hypothetical protein
MPDNLHKLSSKGGGDSGGGLVVQAKEKDLDNYLSP